jgi:Ca-activated chloride channel family protein
MDFEYPGMLYLLLLLPLFVFLFREASRRNSALREQFAKWAVLQQLVPDLATKRNPLKFGLILGAFTMLVIAFANPRSGSVTRKVKKEGVDIYIALDISKSMWAKDVTPNSLDRLEKARLFALKLIEELKGNRIGLIFFAGEAFLQMPLTLDNSAPMLFLNEGLGDFEITQGTVFEEVISLAAKTGKKPDDEDQRIKQKALVILSDGEDHDKSGTKAAKAAKKLGVTTYCIGIGSENGKKVSAERGGDPGYLKDKNGETVVSSADKKWLKEIASAGSGRFFDIEDGDAIFANLKKELNRLEKEDFETQLFDEYESYFQFFVLIALGLLVAEFIISYRKEPKANSADKNANEALLEKEEY